MKTSWCIYFFLSLLLCQSFLIVNSQPAGVNFHALDSFVALNLERYNCRRCIGDSSSLYEYVGKVERKLFKKGYVAFSADSVSKGLRDWQVYAFLGERYQFAILSQGNVNPAAARYAGIYPSFLYGNRFSFPRLYTVKRKVINWYEYNGFPFARVSLDSIQMENQVINTSFRVEPGNYYVFDSLIVKGDTKISPHYIPRLLDMKKGSPYNQDHLDNIAGHLQSIEFVEMARDYRLLFTEDAFDLYLYLNKKKSNQFNGIIGFIPKEENDAGLLLTGDMNLVLRNSFGLGESFFFMWQRLQEKTQKINTSVELPYLFNTDVGLFFSFDMFRQDTSYVSVNPVVGVDLYSSGLNRVRLFYDVKSSYTLQPIDSIQQQFSEIRDYKRWLYGLNIIQQQLNYKPNPSKGYVVDVRFGAGTKQIIGTDAVKNSLLSEGKADLAFFVPLSGKSVMKVRCQGAMLYHASSLNDSADKFYNNELFRIGGYKSLRGFDEESLLASSFLINTLEYRFLYEKNAAVFAFVDWAYYESNAVGGFIHDSPVGFGIGTDFFTNAGLFSVGYALGKQFDNPISLKTAKIHIGYVNRF